MQSPASAPMAASSLASSLASRISWYRWLVFGALATGYMVVFFHRLSPAVLALDMMADLKASAGLMGLLASAYFYPYALMQLPSGLLADSWGPRRTITSFFLLAAVGSVLLGIANTPAWAVAGRALVGLGVAMLFVPTMKILTRWFAPSEFATMAGLLLAVGGLGALAATTPLALLSRAIGWRWSFGIIGLVTLVMAALIWILVRDDPSALGLPQPAQPGFAPKTVSAVAQPRLGQAIKTVLSTAAFWPLACWFFFTSSVFFSLGGLWGGPYLMHVYGMDKTAAGGVLSMLAMAQIVGPPFFSFLSDRLLRSRKKVLILGSALFMLLLAPLGFFPASLSQPLLYAWFFCFGLLGNALVGITFTAVKELFSTQIAGTASGITNVFPFMAGALLQPAIGLILEHWPKTAAGYPAEAYGTMFLVYTCSALLALVAACLATETFGPCQRK